MKGNRELLLTLAACLAMVIAAGSRSIAAPGDPAATPAEAVGRRDGAIADARSVVWRSERVCGLNSLYFLLRCAGVRPDYLALQDVLLKSDMASLYDLKATARDYGMALKIARLTPDQLRSAPRPTIVHMEITGVRGKTSGHFVVVTHTDDEAVSFVDASTAQFHTISWRDFKKGWSGYAAYRDDGQGLPFLGLAAGFLGGSIVGWPLNWLMKGRFSASQPRPLIA